MTVHIHPAGEPESYTDLLLTLLMQAGIPALADEAAPGENSVEVRPVSA